MTNLIPDLMDYAWNYKPIPKRDEIDFLKDALNINPHLSILLNQRGINDFDKAKAFFRPKITDLHDPFLMHGMDVAVDLLTESISNNDNILIYGDYDVDGSCSVALVYSFLKNFCPHLGYYIPDRNTEGYGISEKSIDFAIDNDIRLIITLDCGIRGINTINRAREAGIEVIVCDHHLPGEELPNASAILNPKQVNCNYPFDELCGCGVGFKLLQGFVVQNNVPEDALFEHLDLVATATAADIVPMVGENRVLTYFGLQKLATTNKPGLRQLISKAGFTAPYNVSNLVFGIAPRINAAGRMEHAKHAVEVLIELDEEQSAKNAERIEQFNNERKDRDKATTTEALQMLTQNHEQQYSTVLYKEDWHKGVIGIVASRCIEEYYRPTIILTRSNGVATGSARSVLNYNIHDALEQCSDLLEQFGGHMYAAGLTIKPENITPFKERFEEVVKKTIQEESLNPEWVIDAQIELRDINRKFYNILCQMAPFGPENMQPIFASHDVRDNGKCRLLKNNHLKLEVEQNGHNAEGIAFGQGHHYERVRSGEPFSICYQIQENNYQGKNNLQLFVKDIRFDL